MFFSEKIKNINEKDYVLEIGPGGNPFSRSDVLLEKVFHDPREAERQRGDDSPIKDEDKKKVVYYEGETFPFKDSEFDYVICSHVLEHVIEVDSFVSEILRVGKKGYIEFPTIYYDYLYNIPEHTTFLFVKNGVIYWMLKEESGLKKFEKINEFFFETLQRGQHQFLNDNRDYFFQGFEWQDRITIKKVNSIKSLTYDKTDFTNIAGKRPSSNLLGSLTKIISNLSWKRLRPEE